MLTIPLLRRPSGGLAPGGAIQHPEAVHAVPGATSKEHGSHTALSRHTPLHDLCPQRTLGLTALGQPYTVVSKGSGIGDLAVQSVQEGHWLCCCKRSSQSHLRQRSPDGGHSSDPTVGSPGCFNVLSFADFKTWKSPGCASPGKRLTSTARPEVRSFSFPRATVSVWVPETSPLPPHQGSQQQVSLQTGLRRPLPAP